jgi:hypothetical protein
VISDEGKLQQLLGLLLAAVGLDPEEIWDASKEQWGYADKVRKHILS